SILMSGYLAVTMSATWRQALTSASEPAHMPQVRVTGSASAALDSALPTRSDAATTDARTNEPARIFVMCIAFPPLLNGRRPGHPPTILPAAPAQARCSRAARVEINRTGSTGQAGIGSTALSSLALA